MFFNILPCTAIKNSNIVKNWPNSVKNKIRYWQNRKILLKFRQIWPHWLLIIIIIIIMMMLDFFDFQIKSWSYAWTRSTTWSILDFCLDTWSKPLPGTFSRVNFRASNFFLITNGEINILKLFVSLPTRVVLKTKIHFLNLF